ncbi:MAG: putative lipid II flippase FtsW [Oscillospiraceae bacterium]|nr:putative lipid II flippase FtsW [Oscillospiraceae bacterium]
MADYTYDDSIERGPVDLPFALLTILLLTIGVIMVLSASYARAYYDVSSGSGGNATYYFVRQFLFALLGVAIMFFLSRFPMSFFYRFSGAVMLVSIVLLALVLLVGETVNGAKRWINLGFTTFQPSEVAKIAIVLYFAALICRNKGKLNTLKSLVPFVFVLAAICFLLYEEPHMSGIIIILALGIVMLWLGGVPLKWFVIAFVLVGAVAAVGYFGFSYVQDRVTAWLDPWADASDTGYQIVQSLYTIGSGGLLGLGLGNSRQKYLYLPEEHNDFIFSVVCEELGYIGAMLILCLFALLIIRGYWLSMHARDRYSCLVGAGLTTHLALQVILNVAVVTNTIPTTGISLPFFSYGGTALMLQLAEMGIILSLSRDIPEKK